MPDAPGECPEWVLRLRPRPAENGGTESGRGNEAENGTAERGGPGDGAVGDDAADNTGAMCPKYSFRVAQHLTPRGCL